MLDGSQFELDDFIFKTTILAIPTSDKPIRVVRRVVPSNVIRRNVPVNIGRGATIRRISKDEWEEKCDNAIAKWHFEPSPNGRGVIPVPDLVNGKIVRVKDTKKKSILSWVKKCVIT